MIEIGKKLLDKDGEILYGIKRYHEYLRSGKELASLKPNTIIIFTDNCEKTLSGDKIPELKASKDGLVRYRMGRNGFCHTFEK